MADETNGAAKTEGEGNKQPQINVLAQYVKDLSFENPAAPRSLRTPGKNPNIQVNFNVQVNPLEEEIFEVVLTLEAHTKNDDGALYAMEFVYAGVFRLKDLPQQAIKPVLFIECPALLFPYARRIVSDLTREGGFPPLLLDPIDFSALFRQRLAQEQQKSEAAIQ